MTGEASNSHKPTKADEIRARIALACEWFVLQPPKVKTNRGKVLLSDEVNQWCFQNGISPDWVYLGDVKPLVTADRNRRLAVHEVWHRFNGLTPENRARMLAKAKELLAKHEASL